ncbi:MAG: HEAT repeat domain-containing protein [Cyanobacteria bacterium]|nr:HEAT repeat domain-containing protein [Cyanobacteriota bacterium]MDW8202746.1 HEAT repeat domain-containing protein [Cyanobacteriota bacterium SKYGB_h_bin112]
MTITPESVQQQLSSDQFGDRLRGINQLRQLDPAIAFTLIKPLLNDSNSRVRYAAVSQLATLGHQNPEEALPLLLQRLHDDPEIDVKAVAADALGGLKLRAALPDLLRVYQQTSDWLLRFSIVAALGELGDPEALDFLAEALQSDEDLVRMAAIGSLGELGDPRAIPLIVPFVQDADWQVRYKLVQALSNFSGAEVNAALTSLAKDPVSQVAQEAQACLGGL